MSATTMVRRPVRIVWDEPEGCTSPRGWAGLRWEDHPDRDAYEFSFRCLDNGRRDCVPCGHYLDYSGGTEPGRDGRMIHAVALLVTATSGTLYPGNRARWFHTAAEARAWIERRVRVLVLRLARSARPW